MLVQCYWSCNIRWCLCPESASANLLLTKVLAQHVQEQVAAPAAAAATDETAVAVVTERRTSRRASRTRSGSSTVHNCCCSSRSSISNSSSSETAAAATVGAAAAAAAVPLLPPSCLQQRRAVQCPPIWYIILSFKNSRAAPDIPRYVLPDFPKEEKPRSAEKCSGCNFSTDCHKNMLIAMLELECFRII